MISKDKLIQKVIKTTGISLNKATQAYETILAESAAFRKQELKKVETKVEKAVKVAGKTQIKKIELVKEVPVKTVERKERIKVVEVIKEVPVEVIKEVEKIKEVKVVKEVPVEVVKEVVKEIQVVKEVPIEVIKEVTLIREVEKPVEVIKEVEKIKEVKVPVVKEVKVPVVKEVKVPVEKIVKVVDNAKIEKLQAQLQDLDWYKAEYNAAAKSVEKLNKELEDLKKELKTKPKEVIKEVKVPVVKEVKVPVEKIVKVVDNAKIEKLQAQLQDFNWYKTEYNAAAKALEKLNKELKAKPKQVVKEVKVPVVKEKIVKVVDDKLVKKYEVEIKKLREQLKLKPKEVIKTVEVIKEVPIEVVREVEVVKQVDLSRLRDLMAGIKAKEVSKKVVGEERREGKEVIVGKREVKAGTNKFDDLTKIEGIGPKIALLLNRNGINTFEQLASTKVETIQQILDKEGSKLSFHNPDTWPEQSKLAAAGEWDKLKKLQDKLIGGKK